VQVPRENPSTGRSIARHYRTVCGWGKADAKKAWKAKKGQAAPKSNRRAMSTGEQAIWLKEAAEERYPLDHALAFALLTGLRVSELVKVRREDFHGRSFSVLGKGKKLRDVPMVRGVQQLLGQLPARGWLFPGGSAGHVSAATVEAACRRIGARVPKLDWVTPHVLRHSFTSNQVAQCADPAWLMAALGHDSIRTTHTYVSTIVIPEARASSGKRSNDLRRTRHV
jgi:integrase